MKISNAISVGFVYLPETFIFDSLLNRFAINLGIKCQLNRINDIIIELIKCNFTPICLNSLFDVFVYIFIGDETEIIFMSHSCKVKDFRADRLATKPITTTGIYLNLWNISNYIN